MLFSIIIPVYNVEPYLRECLDSVSHQTFADWEAICVNDGSTDSSGDILSEYAAHDSRFHITTQPNGGLSSARNRGLAHAQGDYILFLDSDDWLENNALEILDSNLHPPTSNLQPLDMLCFGGRRYDEATSTYKPADVLPHITYSSGMEYYNANALCQRDFAFVCVVLRCYRRQFLLDNNLRFREGILHEDNEFTPRACLKAQSIKVIPDVLYNYRVRPNSIMTTIQAEREECSHASPRRSGAGVATTRGIRSKESLILIGNELSELFANESDIERTTVYRALTQYYQMAFLDNTRDEKRHLRHLVDWKCYRRVSRTKLRHRTNYLRNKYL